MSRKKKLFLEGLISFLGMQSAILRPIDAGYLCTWLYVKMSTTEYQNRVFEFFLDRIIYFCLVTYKSEYSSILFVSGSWKQKKHWYHYNERLVINQNYQIKGSIQVRWVFFLTNLNAAFVESLIER